MADKDALDISKTAFGIFGRLRVEHRGCARSEFRKAATTQLHRAEEGAPLQNESGTSSSVFGVSDRRS